MEINLNKLETSISKITDLIDVTLEKLNEEFLVDNFEPPNILKNTTLRKEFNKLWKVMTDTEYKRLKVHDETIREYEEFGDWLDIEKS